MNNFTKRIMKVFKKYSFQITVTSIIFAVFSLIMLINTGAACLWAAFVVLVFTWYIRQEQTEQYQKLKHAHAVENTYAGVASILFALLNEFNFLGLHLTANECCVRCPDDYVRYAKQGFPVFRYRALIKDSFQTGEEDFRAMLNDRIAQELFYQPMYILRIRRTGDRIYIFAILNNCPETDAFIREYEKHKIQAQQTNVDTNVEDF